MLSECFCIIDSREKNTKRIDAVKEFIESHGGAVEIGALPLCDYKIEGIFREKEICIGIEAKSLTDFSGSYQELPDKLARSFELYNDVALFVEIPQIRTSSTDGFHAIIVNQSVPDGSADVLQYAVLQNSLESWQREGVHVRQLQSESLWGYAIASVLISITKDTHRGLEITKVKDYKSQYLNILSKFDGIGLKTAQKIVTQYPNLFWLCEKSEDDLRETIGKVTGKKLYDFIHNNELITAEWLRFGSKEQSQDFQQNASEIKPGKDISIKTYDTTKKDLDSLNKKINELNNKEEDKNVPKIPYLDENKPKFIEVPKGCYVNGGEIRDINPERDQDIETLQLSTPRGEHDSLPVQSLVSGSSQLSKTAGGNLKAQASDGQERKQPQDNPASQTLAGAGSNLPDAPSNDEFTANPRMKDIIEFIRRHPRKLDDVSTEFGLSKDYTFRALNELWHKKKIWFNRATLCFEFGIDKNPAPVIADKEYEVM